MDLNYGGGTILIAISSPTQEIEPIQQTQPIDLNDDGDHSVKCSGNLHSEFTQ